MFSLPQTPKQSCDETEDKNQGEESLFVRNNSDTRHLKVHKSCI